MNSTEDNGYKVRSRMIIFKEGKAIALCPTCKNAVEVPLVIAGELPKAKKPKLIVKNT